MPDRRQSPRDIANPEPCWIRMRMERHGPYIPARIYQGIKGLTAEIDGAETDVDRVWSSGDLITEREWLQLIADRKRPRPF